MQPNNKSSKGYSWSFGLFSFSNSPYQVSYFGKQEITTEQQYVQLMYLCAKALEISQNCCGRFPQVQLLCGVTLGVDFALPEDKKPLLYSDGINYALPFSNQLQAIKDTVNKETRYTYKFFDEAVNVIIGHLKGNGPWLYGDNTSLLAVNGQAPSKVQFALALIEFMKDDRPQGASAFPAVKLDGSSNQVLIDHVVDEFKAWVTAKYAYGSDATDFKASSWISLPSFGGSKEEE